MSSRKNGLFVVGLQQRFDWPRRRWSGEVTAGLEKSARRRRAVPLPVRDRRRGFQGARHHRSGRSRSSFPARSCRCRHAQRFYLARTYAYVADGADGLAFIDITNPEKPHLERLYNAGGQLNDTRAVQIGSISASEFALVADGKNGLRVLQMISPENVPGAAGFSPAPNPKLIATFPTRATGPGRFARAGPRPRRGRKRQSDRRVWPARLPSVPSR